MKLEELLSAELYAQVKAAIDAHNAAEQDKLKHVRFADLSEGGYVSKEKHGDEVNGLRQQIEALTQQATAHKASMDDLTAKLTAAQADASKLGKAQAALATAKADYEAAQRDWADKLARQTYESLVREKAGELTFSSAAAKRDFIREVTGKDLKVEGGKMIGYDDVLSAYKAENPGAINEPMPSPDPVPAPAPTPTIVLPSGGGDPGAHKSLSELMRQKNENPNATIVFGK